MADPQCLLFIIHTWEVEEGRCREKNSFLEKGGIGASKRR